GVDPASVLYMTGGEEQSGRDEKLKLDLPERFRLKPIGPDQTLSQMLRYGDIDALYTARTPSTFYTHPDQVRRLFPDFVAVEQDYFRRTRIFPIMHVVASRREIYEANRWVARALFKAFVAAQAKVYRELRVTASLKTMLPWQIAAVEQTAELMGEDWWPYGVERNRHVLETFLRYHYEQGLSASQLAVDDLFAPECFEEFRI
ncbi:MAG: ABC transporter substrate-binding protein, partial [Tsuneonella sp.]